VYHFTAPAATHPDITPESDRTGGESALYSFKGGTKDGENPYGNLVLSGTLLIGTTYNGGSGSAGTVFELAPPATTGGAWTETLLYNFAKGTEGISPYAGLVSGLNGALYGTTFSGGTIRDGTVFDLVL
jgi:hypothetical protein